MNEKLVQRIKDNCCPICTKCVEGREIVIETYCGIEAKVCKEHVIREDEDNG